MSIPGQPRPQRVAALHHVASSTTLVPPLAAAPLSKCDSEAVGETGEAGRPRVHRVADLAVVLKGVVVDDIPHLFAAPVDRPVVSVKGRDAGVDRQVGEGW